MRVRKPLLAVFAFLVNGASSQAATHPRSVQFLYEACKQDLASETPGFCMGYIEAAAQIMITNAMERQKVLPNDTEARRYLSEFSLCPNPSVNASGAALIQTFVNWAEKHPERSADHALDGVVQSLAAIWSCPNSN